MKQPIVIIGMGELGGVFGRGFLRLGYPVYPITRKLPMETAVKEFPPPVLVLVAVAEADIHEVLEELPKPWRGKVALLQNELLPRDWEQHRVSAPTVISVWFEKKVGQEPKVILPSPVFGPHAQLLHDALTAIGIPARVLKDHDELVFELVRKNVYILTSNLAGLATGGTVGELWKNHREFALKVAGDIIKIQTRLVKKELPWDKLIAGMVEAFDGDPGHKCMGRTAPVRLIRVLAQAAEVGVEAAKLKEIQGKM